MTFISFIHTVRPNDKGSPASFFADGQASWLTDLSSRQVCTDCTHPKPSSEVGLDEP